MIVKEQQPLVTVYIPTKNRAELLLRAVNSTLSQTYDNIEIIVIDDGSTDETPELLSDLAAYNSNLKWFRFEQSQGAPKARNYAIEQASGELITGLDDDDFFLPKRIETLVSHFDEKFAFVCSGFYWNHGKKKTKVFGRKALLDLNVQLYFNHASNQVLTKTERLKAVGGFDLSFPSCQDWELWTRLIKHYGSALRISDVNYIVDASHLQERITDGPKRLEGFKKLADKYSNDMTSCHKRAMKFNLIFAAREKLTFARYVQVVTPKTLLRTTKYWLATLFPEHAKKRLNKMK